MYFAHDTRFHEVHDAARLSSTYSTEPPNSWSNKTAISVFTTESPSKASPLELILRVIQVLVMNLTLIFTISAVQYVAVSAGE